MANKDSNNLPIPVIPNSDQLQKGEQPDMSSLKLVPDYKSEQIEVSNCKLCKSSYRAEAESLYDRTGNARHVWKFLSEERQEEISYNAVNNHLSFHYTAHNNGELVREFGKDLQVWVDIQGDDLLSLRRTIAILEREMAVIAAKSEECSLPERRKSADIIQKLAASLLSHRTRLLELERGNEPVTVIFNQLQIIIQEEMATVDSDETKICIKRILERLSDSCGDMIVDKGD
jgi:hypothetical protein